MRRARPRHSVAVMIRPTRGRRRVLSAAEEVRLCRRIERGDPCAKDRMIEANMGLVHALAKVFTGSGVAYDDLVQEGTIGLVRAVEKFDYRRGHKFSTYAVWWVRRALIDAVGEARAIRIPAQAARSIAAVRRAEGELRRGAKTVATTEAIAARTGLTAARVRELRAAPSVTVSLDTWVGEDGWPLVDLVADPDAADPWRAVDAQAVRREVAAMVATLPSRHREVVVRRYGLRGRPPSSHAEIGASLGIGEERCRQLEREALQRLRQLDCRYLRAA
jgi:RNA polymerase primary sigma factor